MTSGWRGRAPAAAASATNRVGATPIRAGMPTARRAAVSTEASVPAVQAQQPARVETNEAGAQRLNRRPDRFERDQHPLVGVGDTGRVGWDQRQLLTAGERLAQAHPRIDPEGLRGGRDRADLLAAGLRSDRGRDPERVGAGAGGNRQLKAEQQDAGDQWWRGDGQERTYVRINSPSAQLVVGSRSIEGRTTGHYLDEFLKELHQTSIFEVSLGRGGHFARCPKGNETYDRARLPSQAVPRR